MRPLQLEKDLITIAQQALHTLPSDWRLGLGDNDSEHPGVPYFYNTFTEESRWTHPNEAVYLDMVVKERAKSNTLQKNEDISVKREIVDESLHIEEFEEWETNQDENGHRQYGVGKFGLYENDFDVDHEHSCCKGIKTQGKPKTMALLIS